MYNCHKTQSKASAPAECGYIIIKESTESSDHGSTARNRSIAISSHTGQSAFLPVSYLRERVVETISLGHISLCHVC